MDKVQLAWHDSHTDDYDDDDDDDDDDIFKFESQNI